MAPGLLTFLALTGLLGGGVYFIKAVSLELSKRQISKREYLEKYVSNSYQLKAFLTNFLSLAVLIYVYFSSEIFAGNRTLLGKFIALGTVMFVGALISFRARKNRRDELNKIKAISG